MSKTQKMKWTAFKKSILLNVILFVILYFSVEINKTYLRPLFHNNETLDFLTGIFPNFIAALIISLFALTPLKKRNISIKKSRIFFYIFSILVFLALAIEEIRPYADVSKVSDTFDIIASAVGSIFAIILFELFYPKKQNEKKI